MSDVPQNAASRRPRRWWLRISLRSLLIAVTLLAIALGYLTHRAREQERAVRAIQNLGGTVHFDYQFGPQGYLAEARPRGPAWIIRRIGPHFTATVIEVRLWREGGGAAQDEDLEILRALPYLRTLSLGSSPAISDSGLKHIAGLKHLIDLDLADTSITDEGLAHLRGLENLRGLHFVRCRIDGSGLRHVRHLPLQFLNLNWTQLTDANVEHVGAMKHLESLVMQDTLITDRALFHVQGLTNLRELHVHNTSVSDVGLVYLQGLTKLKSLELHNTKVTKEGLAGLKQKIPGLPKP
jgi:Leucine Rich Repeat (LRR) protein